MNKLKIGIGVCGAILSLMAININTVHADAINWDNADSSGVTTDGAVNQLANNNVRTGNVQSTKLSKSNFVKTSNVQAGQINKTKIAQFNSDSKIYGLNNSNELSKNNGDGYVITNAGTYNGHQVDIGVTINNVQNNQGSYTTKWSNGDKAGQTGKVDNDFNYQNGVTVNSNVLQPVAPDQTRDRVVQQATTVQNPKYSYHYHKSSYTGQGQYGDTISGVDYFIAPNLIQSVQDYCHVDEKTAVSQVVSMLTSNGEELASRLQYDGKEEIAEFDDSYDKTNEHLARNFLSDQHLIDAARNIDDYTFNESSSYIVIINHDFDFSKVHSLADLSGNLIDTIYVGDSDISGWSSTDQNKYAKLFKPGYTWSETRPANVTDHLQIDQVKNGNLNYDYTIGLYDHDTGNLITSLKPEYKDGVKVGKTATIADTVMNNAIKNKIADIRSNRAAVAFNGTAANDNVAFYQETTPVQDVSKLTATASRTITLHFPNNQKPASYDKLVDNNNQIVQTLKFTRTGTTDLVTGQTTYSSWSGSTKFPDIPLPKIPGFKLQIS